jgi:hypothetical protein
MKCSSSSSSNLTILMDVFVGCDEMDVLVDGC